MRRVVSVILLVIGGWILMTEATVAWMDVGAGTAMHSGGLAMFAAVAAVPLMLGTWASPGNRLADLGLTLMVAAGVALFAVLTMVLTVYDPAVANMLPPGQPKPDLDLMPVLGSINLLLVAGTGYSLWRRGRARAQAKGAELERVFGD